MVVGPELSVSVSWEQLAVIFSSITSVCSIVGVVWTIIFQAAKNKVQMDILWAQQDKTKTDQKTTWSFLMRRAQTETIEKKFAVIAPTLIIDKVSYDLFPRHLRLRMIQALSDHCGMPDGEFMLEIERQFGDEILNEVCIPNSLKSGACLYIAADMIRNTVVDPVTTH